MASISEDIQCAGSDTHPPMLDRSDFESWQQRIRLYCMEKDNGENIIKSIDEGPFKIGKFKETLVEGLPKDIYTLINHYTDAKDIWDNVKMLLEGSELTKDERESQLYDDFEHFRQNKGETIYEYYGRFVTVVKLNRGLKISNYDQLYAYLKQHEARANENKLMLDRYNQQAIDPLALMSKVSPPQYPTQSSGIPQSTYVPPVSYQQQFVDNTQLDSVQNGRVVVQNVQGRENRGQWNNARGAGATGNWGIQNRGGNTNHGQARQIKCYNCNGIRHIAKNCTQPKRPRNSEYFKDKMLLMQAQENGVALDEEQLLFIAGGQDNAFDANVDKPPVQDLALNVDNIFQADQCDAFDSNVDEALTAQTMFMANLSSADPIYDEASLSYDSDILSEVVALDAEYTSDSNIIMYDQYVKDNAVPVVQSDVSSVPNDVYMMIVNEMHEQAAQCVSANEQNKVVNALLTAELARYKEQVELYEKGQAIGYKNPLYLTKAKQVQFALYNGHEIVKTNHTLTIVHDSEETLDIAEKTRIGMLDKMKSTLWVDNKIKIGPPDYSKEHYLATFTLQRQLTPEQIFWSSDIAKMIPKPISKLTVYLPNTPKGKEVSNTKECYLTEVIPFFKTLKEHFEGVQKALIKEVKEIKEIFEQIEAEVGQNAVDKESAEIEKKILLIENENLIADCFPMNSRIVNLEAEIYNLKHKIQKDDHNEMVKHFSKLKVEHLNLQLKYQHLKESFGNNKSETSQDVPAFDSVFVIRKLKEQLQGRGNTIRELKEEISQLKEKRREADHILDFKALDSQNKDLTEKFTAL
ncbi:hypothetical protein Tco_1504535 [Tanacetum coccineum]